MTRPVRPLYWSIRRELWENRSIYIAPLTVAGIFLFGFLISTTRLPQRMRTLAALDLAKQRHAVSLPFSMAASLIIVTGFAVGVFYCLDALHGERRDRSILFWKSMPVSDFKTVLSKASIPFVVQPLLAFTLALATQCIMVLVSAAVVAGSGNDAAAWWARLPIFQMTLVMFYGLAVHALWYAPIYAWLLLVSAWARRAVILWAALPFLALGIIERMAFGTKVWPAFMRYRLLGAMKEGFGELAPNMPVTHLSLLTPGRFFSSAGLWLGLIFAAACLAAAVRLRRNREPI